MERISSQRLAQVEDGLRTLSTSRFERQVVRKVPLAKPVRELLAWIGGPIDLKALVYNFALLLSALRAASRTGIRFFQKQSRDLKPSYAADFFYSETPREFR